GGLIRAFNRLEDGVRSCAHTAGYVTCLEPRRNLLADDAGGTQIGQRDFEPIADLDPELPFLKHDEQEYAVVGPLLSELPRRRDTMGIRFERLSLEGRQNKDPDWVAGFFLVLLELFGKLGGVLSGQDCRKIHDATGQRGN